MLNQDFKKKENSIILTDISVDFNSFFFSVYVR